MSEHFVSRSHGVRLKNGKSIAVTTVNDIPKKNYYNFSRNFS